MDLKKLRSTREGHRRVCQQQLAKVEEAKGKSTLTEFHAIIEALTAKAQTIQMLNQLILEQKDVKGIEEKIIQDKEYTFNLEISIGELRPYSKVQLRGTYPHYWEMLEILSPWPIYMQFRRLQL